MAKKKTKKPVKLAEWKIRECYNGEGEFTTWEITNEAVIHSCICYDENDAIFICAILNKQREHEQQDNKNR